MFRLAVFTDEISQDPERAVAVAREFSLQGVEIRSVWDTAPQDLSEAQIADLDRLLRANGLQVCAIASPFLKTDIADAAATERQYEVLDRCIRLGKRLGTNLIRGFTFWRTEDVPEVWEEAERVYRSILPRLEAEDALMVVENEPDTSGATAALTARFLARMNHPRIRAVWDPANEVCAAAGERPFPEAYRRMQPYAIHIHVKDAARDADGKGHSVRIGGGEVPWREHLHGLLADGYRGWLSLETHWRPVELTDDQFRRPGGQAFSENAEEASRLCLSSLQAIIEQVGA